MNFLAILPLIQLAANATLAVLGGQETIPANIAPLVAGIFTSVTPLISAIESGSAKEVDILAAYGTLIGTLNALKGNTSLPAETLAKVQEYILAAQDATTAYLASQKGYDGSTLVPVTPIS